MAFLSLASACIHSKSVGSLYGLSMSEANYCFTDIIIDIGVEREGIDAATPGSGLCNDSALATKVLGNLRWFCAGHYLRVSNKAVQTNRSFAAEQTECGTLYERTKMSYERTRALIERASIISIRFRRQHGNSKVALLKIVNLIKLSTNGWLSPSPAFVC